MYISVIYLSPRPPSILSGAQADWFFTQLTAKHPRRRIHALQSISQNDDRRFTPFVFPGRPGNAEIDY
jgi:hypothetical protein